MTVTTEPTLTGVTVPSTERRSGRIPVWLGWSLAVVALVAAAAFVTVAIQSDEPATVSPATVEPATAHAGIIENGSPTAVDHPPRSLASPAPAPPASRPVAGGSHSLIIEYGSPTAVDHAAEEARNG